MEQLDRTESGAPPRTQGTLGRYVVDAIGSAFALYWVSNLILWYPWSISATVGITVMLTLVPVLWAFGIGGLLLRWPGPNLWVGAACTAATMLVISIATDLVFFGVVRDAGRELLQPATYAGYAWVALLPFLVVAVARRWIDRRRTPVTTRDILTAFSVALVAFAVIVVIITFDLRLPT